MELDVEKNNSNYSNADSAKTAGRRESIESSNTNSHEDAETSIARRKKPRDATNDFLTPMHTTRSRSSVRSQRSYAGADGYTHFEHDEQHDSSTPHRNENEEKNGTPNTNDHDVKAFEVRWEGPDDPMNPKSAAWAPYWRKWTIVILGSVSSMCVTFGSALYTSAYGGIERQFGISRLAATVGLSIFVCGLGLGPMFLSPLSEFYGRRPIYLCAFGMYFIWLIPCALANNLATMLVARFLDGLAGSAFLSVAGGTVGDTFPKEKLSMPMMIYSAAPFCGPLLGPVVGNFIASYKSWRWCFYVLMMWAGVNWLMLFFFVPETYSPVLLRRKARQLRKDTGDDRWKAPIEMMNKSVAKTVMWSCIRPFQLLALEPMCTSLCLLSAVLLGVLYLFFGAFPLVFGNNHGFNLWQTGLTFLGLFVGNVIGVSCDPFWRRNYDRLVRNNGGISEPEFRLAPTIAGAILVPISLFGFGWTTFPWVHWIVPIIFSVLFGLANIWCFSGIFTFLVECYPLYAASGLAANSFARSSFAAAFPLFGVQLYNSLGYQWASSLLAFIALAMAPFPILFFKYGKRLRGNSRFAQGS